MKGLIRKDLLNIRGTMAYMLLIGVIFSIVFGECSMMIPTMILSCLIATTFTYDRNSGWDAFAVSVGTRRKEIVDSKFVLALMLMALGLAIGISVTLICNNIEGLGMDPDAMVDAALMAMSAGLIVIGVCCAVNYAVNSDKALAVTGMTSSICVIVAVMIAMLIGTGDVKLAGAIPVITLVIGAAIFAAGYIVSQRLFGRRDL